MSAIDNLVTEYNDVLINIYQFNEDLQNDEEVAAFLSQFKHWYYIPDLNMFGPSKYIGYKNMNSIVFNQGIQKSEVETGKVLKEWFYPLEPNTNEDLVLRTELASLLEQADKKLRANAIIHVPKSVLFLMLEPKSVG
ncbi:hypothetical protein IM538_09210 [Cytobacillus suaedae]|nr:hypothetical protein IM538_09210 [Cytobacillus suaedae]